MISKLDRLGRTTKQLIELSQWLEENKVDLQIIDMNISTRDAMGKIFFTMMSAFAELEANLLSERIKKEWRLLELEKEGVHQTLRGGAYQIVEVLVQITTTVISGCIVALFTQRLRIRNIKKK